MSIPPWSIRTLADVSHLPADVTPAQLAEAYADDEDAFSLLCVAQAVRSQVPAGVTNMLTSQEFCWRWLETLLIQEGEHQMSWAAMRRRLGEADEKVLKARDKLKLIRARRREALARAKRVTRARRLSATQAAARKRLVCEHEAEAEALKAELLHQTGIGEDLRVTPAIQRLIDMEYENFRNLVAGDVQGHKDVDLLGHPALTARWREALNDLAELTLSHLGLDADPKIFEGAWFTLPDESVARIPADKWPEMAGRLTFLTHLRGRLAERRGIVMRHNRRLGTEIYEPIEDRLIDTYRDEYTRYLLDVDLEIAPTPPAELPRDLSVLREAMEAAGWRVRRICEGRRVWLDARNGDVRVAASAARTSKGATGWSWKRHRYLAQLDEAGRFTLISRGELKRIVSDPGVFDRQDPKYQPLIDPTAVAAFVQPLLSMDTAH